MKGPPPAPVHTARAELKAAPLDINVVGNVEAYSTIGVKSLVGGALVKVSFAEGDFVRKGGQLFQIDARPFEAALKLAEANVARDQAMLQQAKANLGRDKAQAEYARSQAARYENLFKSGVIPRNQADQFSSDATARAEAVNADRAAIDSAQASLEADKAAVESARLQLEYTHILSPIDGRTGNLAVKQGNVVKANDINLVSINQVQPILVTFAIPENRLADVKQFMARAKLPVLATPQGEQDAETGSLVFVDNAVDAATGTIKLKGTFPNPRRRLWPGQFVQVILRLTTENAVVVPSEAVQTSQQGQYVFVVKGDGTVEMRPVTPGRSVQTATVIASGLQAGETVVTEGQLRLMNGSKVQVRKAGATED
jgi:membrane fusion protein, multidrug efflux system